MTATESTSAKLRRVEQERDEARDTAALRQGQLAAARHHANEARRQRDEARAELDAERDKRAEDIASYERACGLAVVAERERDTLRLAVAVARTARIDIERERDLARAELASARTARDNLDRQLAAAHKEIEQLDDDLNLCPRCGIAIDADITGDTPALASWMVARDGGRSCVRCDQEIRRGEAYELLPDVDELRHIHCRDPEESSDG